MTSGDRFRAVRRLLRLRISDRAIESEIDDELAFHLDERMDYLRACGMSPDAARSQARAEFGDLEASHRELADLDRRRLRSAYRWTLIEELWQDTRFAVRTVWARPLVSAVVAISLAVGIAATTTVFAAIDAYLIQPLPYTRPVRLVAIWTCLPSRGDRLETSAPDFIDWRGQVRGVDLAAYTVGDFNLAGNQEPERVSGARISWRLLTILGAMPAAGSGFSEANERLGTSQVIILSDALWRRRFASDSAILGKVLALDGASYRIVGIMPPAFAFPRRTVELWIPLPIDALQGRDARTLSVIGRLRDGVSLPAARAELAAIASRLARSYGDDRDATTRVEPLDRAFYDDTFRLGTTLSMLAAALVLLIACANIANLLLARGLARTRELAVRGALGAARARLVRQLLTESVVLALAGGILGVLLAFAGVRVFAAIVPPTVERTDTIALNGHVLLFTLAVTVTAGLAFGALPAIRATRGSAAEILRAGDPGSTTGRHSHLAAGLAIAELSLAVALLVPAGLLLKAAARLQTMHVGFEPHGLVVTDVSLPTTQYPDRDKLISTEMAVLHRLAALPTVDAAGGVSRLPMTTGVRAAYVVAEDNPIEHGREPTAQLRVATPGYFGTMGIAMLRGRDFTDRDRIGSVPVAVVSEAIARRHWPAGDAAATAIGRRIVLASDSQHLERTVIGVVGDTREFGPYEPASSVLYLPALQFPARRMAYVVRVGSSTAFIGAAIREATREVDAQLPAYDARRMDDVIRSYELPAHIMPRMLATFAAVALLLTIIGVYGVFAHAVSQRTRELGVRIALGAARGDILRLVMGRAAVLIGVGLATGLAGAAALSRALGFFLFGVDAFDPAVFATVSVSIVAASAVASYVPARRATRVDALEALRAN
jgi:predicted permease